MDTSISPLKPAHLDVGVSIVGETIGGTDVGVGVGVGWDCDAGVSVNTAEGWGLDGDPNPQANVKRIRVNRANESQKE